MKLVQKKKKKKKVGVTKAKATICGHGETGENKKERDEREREIWGGLFWGRSEPQARWGGRKMKKKTRRHDDDMFDIHISYFVRKITQLL